MQRRGKFPRRFCSRFRCRNNTKIITVDTYNFNKNAEAFASAFFRHMALFAFLFCVFDASELAYPRSERPLAPAVSTRL